MFDVAACWSSRLHVQFQKHIEMLNEVENEIKNSEKQVFTVAEVLKIFRDYKEKFAITTAATHEKESCEENLQVEK